MTSSGAGPGYGAAKVGRRVKDRWPKPNVAESSLATYLERVRAETLGDDGRRRGRSGRRTGGWRGLSTDVRAMRPHDLISVVVQENLAASTDGTVKNSRASNASSSVSSGFGTLHAGNALQNLVQQNSAAGLNAAGQSATNSSLTTTLGGQVIEVLPNGMLVIEAARQVEFSQQTQTIVLRGLVRPEDISQQNQVLSTAISSLELEVKGKGIINDYTHRQNALVRLLQQIAGVLSSVRQWQLGKACSDRAVYGLQLGRRVDVALHGAYDGRAGSGDAEARGWRDLAAAGGDRWGWWCGRRWRRRRWCRSARRG